MFNAKRERDFSNSLLFPCKTILRYLCSMDVTVMIIEVSSVDRLRITRSKGR